LRHWFRRLQHQNAVLHILFLLSNKTFKMGTFIKSRIYCQCNDIKWFHIVYTLCLKIEQKSKKGKSGQIFCIFARSKLCKLIVTNKVNSLFPQLPW
jgi:hypothetical protein